MVKTSNITQFREEKKRRYSLELRNFRRSPNFPIKLERIQLVKAPEPTALEGPLKPRSHLAPRGGAGSEWLLSAPGFRFGGQQKIHHQPRCAQNRPLTSPRGTASANSVPVTVFHSLDSSTVPSQMGAHQSP